VTAGRWATISGLASALYFAIQGGEYGTLDLLQLRREEAEERADVLRLQRLVDSLTKAAVAIELDPRMQERVARERFGMIKKGEFLYRLVPSSDSATATETREREEPKRER
jgi:cell division protein FtsB